MRSLIAALWALGASVALTACGGGGGGEAATAPAVSFTPGILAANVQSGTSATINVRATANDPSSIRGTLYVVIVDSAQVLTPSVQFAPIDERTLSVTVHTTPTLAPGRHQGTLQIRLCNDPACASQLPGSPASLPYDFSIAAAPLNAAATSTTAATVHRGGSIDAPVAVSVSAAGLDWTASTATAWLKVVGGSGSGSGSFAVEYLVGDIAEGRYTGAVNVSATDGQTAWVPFTLQVLPTQFVVTSGAASFAAVNGAPIPPRQLDFQLNNGVQSPWTASVSANWLVATPTGGSTPASVSLLADPTRGGLESGNHGANLVLSADGIPDLIIATQLALTPATLSAGSSAVTLGGPKGRDLAAAQTLAASLNTGARSWPFSLSGLPAWLSSTTMSGTINQSGTAVSLKPAAGVITPGSRSATISMTAAVNGDTIVMPITVNLNADQRRLLASEWGIGLAASPTGTVLSRTLAISDNFGGALSWTASSDVPWLAVTASGSTASGSSLVLTADPSSLADGAVSHANVTVATATGGVEPAVVRVALWKSAAGLAATARLPTEYAAVVADKIRPYVYANNGGTTIDVYNAYTAQKISTITNVGAALGRMSVSPDGRHLYALDAAARSMAVIDLSTLTKSATWALDNAVSPWTSLVAIRPNGVEIVLLGDGTAYVSGRSLGATQALGELVASSDGRKVFSLAGAYSVDYSEMSGGIVFADFVRWIDGQSGGNLREVAVNKEGTRLYQASGGGVASGGYKCGAIDAAAGTFIGALPGGEAYPNNVEVTSDGRPICGISGWYAASDFWVHSPAGALLAGYKVAGYAREIKTGQMVVTPDGFVVVALTDDPFIAFVPIGP